MAAMQIYEVEVTPVVLTKCLKVSKKVSPQQAIEFYRVVRCREVINALFHDKPLIKCDKYPHVCLMRGKKMLLGTLCTTLWTITSVIFFFLKSFTRNFVFQ
jgi:hypothetical protein